MPSMDEKEPARRHIERLAGLVGSWRGTGTARFPTIEGAEYREELRFDWNASEALLHFEQKTWWKGDTPLHWESGFVLADDAGLYTLVNSQNNGRLEALDGRLEERTGGLELRLASRHFGNDPRMRRATRLFVLEGDRLRYEVAMSTTRVADLTPHLRAELERRQEPQARSKTSTSAASLPSNSS